MASARASAIRCRWPPESWDGSRSANWDRWTSDSSSSTLAAISRLGRFLILSPKPTLPATLMCRNAA